MEMRINKLKIKNNFDQASSSYDQVAHIQEVCAALLVDYFIKEFPAFVPYNILDIGAGTGFSTKSLIKHFPSSHYLLNDISSNMLEQAKLKFINYNNINFDCSDMELKEFEHYDLIISNFALQWTENLEEIIRKLKKKSKILAFTCLLDGTFKEWPFTLNYPRREELEQNCILLNPKYFTSKIEEFNISFTSVKEFLLYLRKLGANGCDKNCNIIPLRKILENPITLSYKVFFGMLE